MPPLFVTQGLSRTPVHWLLGLPRKAQGSTAAATAPTPPVEPARKASSPWSSAAVGGPQSPLRAYKERVPVVGLQHHARYPTTTRTHLLHHTPQTQPPGRPSALYRQTDYGGFPRLPSSPYVTMAAIRFPTLLIIVAAAVVAAASGAVRTTMAAPAPSDACDPFLPCAESGECPDRRA